ncbi:Hypothetical protein NTJ_12838 [Nesidiocoris tenuis]|uniref:THAP-type domain-containing protein n=1 Tax=Nesidiocoris tenuis TaxID=355587 RepID=A0ABN7BA37_9HEMI|nr:Hypothetical protein NTJ_12838 [Nesidiocoris tenuis]
MKKLKSCVVPGCNGQGGHQLPERKERKLKWLEAIRYDSSPDTLCKSSLVCHKHFVHTDYRDPFTPGSLGRGRRLRLKGSAVPSVFDWTPSVQRIPDQADDAACQEITNDSLRAESVAPSTPQRPSVDSITSEDGIVINFRNGRPSSKRLTGHTWFGTRPKRTNDTRQLLENLEVSFDVDRISCPDTFEDSDSQESIIFEEFDSPVSDGSERVNRLEAESFTVEPKNRPSKPIKTFALGSELEISLDDSGEECDSPRSPVYSSVKRIDELDCCFWDSPTSPRDDSEANLSHTLLEERGAYSDKTREEEECLSKFPSLDPKLKPDPCKDLLVKFINLGLTINEREIPKTPFLLCNAENEKSSVTSDETKTLSVDARRSKMTALRRQRKRKGSVNTIVRLFDLVQPKEVHVPDVDTRSISLETGEPSKDDPPEATACSQSEMEVVSTIKTMLKSLLSQNAPIVHTFETNETETDLTRLENVESTTNSWCADHSSLQISSDSSSEQMPRRQSRDVETPSGDDRLLDILSNEDIIIDTVLQRDDAESTILSDSSKGSNQSEVLSLTIPRSESARPDHTYTVHSKKTRSVAISKKSQSCKKKSTKVAARPSVEEPAVEVTPDVTPATDVTTATNIVIPETSVVSPETDVVPPETDVATPATDVATPATDVVTPATDVVTPETDVLTPETDVATPATDVVTPATDVVTPATDVVTPATDVVTPAIDLDTEDDLMDSGMFNIEELPIYDSSGMLVAPTPSPPAKTVAKPTIIVAEPKRLQTQKIKPNPQKSRPRILTAERKTRIVHSPKRAGIKLPTPSTTGRTESAKTSVPKLIVGKPGTHSGPEETILLEDGVVATIEPPLDDESSTAPKIPATNRHCSKSKADAPCSTIVIDDSDDEGSSTSKDSSTEEARTAEPSSKTCGARFTVVTDDDDDDDSDASWNFGSPLRIDDSDDEFRCSSPENRADENNSPKSSTVSEKPSVVHPQKTDDQRSNQQKVQAAPMRKLLIGKPQPPNLPKKLLWVTPSNMKYILSRPNQPSPENREASPVWKFIPISAPPPQQPTPRPVAICPKTVTFNPRIATPSVDPPDLQKAAPRITTPVVNMPDHHKVTPRTRLPAGSDDSTSSPEPSVSDDSYQSKHHTPESTPRKPTFGAISHKITATTKTKIVESNSTPLKGVRDCLREIADRVEDPRIAKMPKDLACTRVTQSQCRVYNLNGTEIDLSLDDGRGLADQSDESEMTDPLAPALDAPPQRLKTPPRRDPPRQAKKPPPRIDDSFLATRTEAASCVDEFACPECSMPFHSELAFSEHMETVHPPSDTLGIVYFCNFCSFETRCDGDLRSHMDSLHRGNQTKPVRQPRPQYLPDYPSNVIYRPKKIQPKLPLPEITTLGKEPRTLIPAGGKRTATRASQEVKFVSVPANPVDRPQKLSNLWPTHASLSRRFPQNI